VAPGSAAAGAKEGGGEDWIVEGRPGRERRARATRSSIAPRSRRRCTTTGEPFSKARVAADRERLLEVYAGEGRPYTTIADSVVTDSLAASVTFLIREAPGTKVRNVIIEGTRGTKHFVIRRELTVERGDLLRRSQVIESRERLLETGFFRDVRFEPMPIDSTAPPRVLDLKLTVVERKMGWAVAGVGYNSSKQVHLSGELGQRNILGNAHRLVGRGRLAFDIDALLSDDRPSIEESRTEVAFLEPWLFSTRTTGTVSVFRETSREAVAPAAGNIIAEEAIGVSLAAERRMRCRTTRVRASLENRWVTQDVQTVQVIAGDTTLVAGRQDFVTRSIILFAGATSATIRSIRRGTLTTPRRDRGRRSGARRAVAEPPRTGIACSETWSWRRGCAVAGIDPRDYRPAAVNQVPWEDHFEAAARRARLPEIRSGRRRSPLAEQPATAHGLATIIAPSCDSRSSGPLPGPLDGGNVWEEAPTSLDDFFPIPTM
jgi:hypothetical protein